MDPESLARLAARQRRLSEPSWSEEGRPRWLEGRPEERGRSVLVESGPGGERRALNPPGTSARSRLHAYGAGSYAADGAGGIFFVEEGTQELIHLPKGGGILVHPPPRPGALGGLVRDPFHRRLLLVHETEEGDRLLAFRLDDARWEILHEEDGFLMQPCADPGGRRIAWIAWDTDAMPWERTHLVTASLDPEGRPRRPFLVRGGASARLEPLFAPGGDLLVLNDGNGRWRIEREGDGTTRVFAETEGEIGRPAWNASVRHYGFTDKETLLAIEVRSGASRLLRGDGEGRLRPLPIPWTDVTDLAAGPTRALVLAGSHDTPLLAAVIDPDGGPPRILASSLPEALPGATEELPAPESRSWPTRDGLGLHGWYYAPRAALGHPPPLVLRCHGGPTGSASPLFDPRVLLWRSLGAAVLDLNYRGSSGFGRAYRLALAGRWGRSDPADVLRALASLVGEGAVDPARLALAGSSAGGYTVLRALERRAVRAAVLWYPVTDLEALEDEEVRFEKPYGAHLLDPDPGRRRRRARLRSPRPRGGLLTTPLLVVQGENDPVVPAHTTEAFVDRLRAHGARVTFRLLPGEGHGFRRRDNLEQVYGFEASFLASLLGLGEQAP